MQDLRYSNVQYDANEKCSRTVLYGKLVEDKPSAHPELVDFPQERKDILRGEEQEREGIIISIQHNNTWPFISSSASK